MHRHVLCDVHMYMLFNFGGIWSIFLCVLNSDSLITYSHLIHIVLKTSNSPRCITPHCSYKTIKYSILGSLPFIYISMEIAILNYIRTRKAAQTAEKPARPQIPLSTTQIAITSIYMSNIQTSYHLICKWPWLWPFEVTQGQIWRCHWT